MATKQRLELTWIGKYEQPNLEPRILIEDPSKSYGDKRSENMLIHGDNLLALKALEQDFANKIKCIYIDPPYNTGNAFDHYDDGLEHSQWLNLMAPRLRILKNLLRDDGVILIQIDDYEMAYLKVLCDEIFGRNNFIENIIWKKRGSAPNDKKIGAIHEYILLYGKDFKNVLLNRKQRSEEQINRYSNPDNHPKGDWAADNLMANVKGGRFVKSLHFPIVNPNTKEKHYPGENGNWRFNKEKIQRLLDSNEIYFGLDGKGRPKLKRFLCDVKEGVPYSTLWDDLPQNNAGSKEIETLFGNVNFFHTPKPEALIKQILELASNEGDVILDSFLGSGTTAAVAHKMGRKWIGIELGEHAETHCLLRLKKVVNGNDGLSLSTELGWKGGGGFKYYDLAPSLLRKDNFGNWVIEEQYKPDMLASAMAKHEGFKYCPDQQVYWKHGQSTERAFIYTTTNFLTVEMLDKIHGDMKHSESLLICCKSFSKICDGKYANVTVKKIPNMLLGRCEFGKNDYSLNIVSMPVDEEEDFVPAGPEVPKVKLKRKK